MFIQLEGLYKSNRKDHLVTGGNAGIGFGTAEALLAKNATVYIACRSVEKGNQAIDKLKSTTNNSKVHLLQMDLADLHSVQKAADEFQRREGQLHILINNAPWPSQRSLTTQGYDLQFGTNVLGHYLFTKLLIPMMEKTAASLPASQPVRIVELTSDGHNFNPWTGTGVISYDTLHDSATRNKAGEPQLYCQSKSGNLLVAKARARILKGKNVISIAVNPGRIHSDLIRHRGVIEKTFVQWIGYPSQMGPINSCYAATFPDVTGFNGAYFSSWAHIKAPRSDHVDNVEAEDKLVAWLEEQLRVNNAE